MDKRTQTLLRQCITITQAAELLGVTRNTVHLAIYSGKLQGVLIGSIWLLQKSDVLAFIDEKRRTPTKNSRANGGTSIQKFTTP